MKRTKEITIIHYRRRRVKKSRAATEGGCPACGNGSDLITVTEAIRLTGISPSTLDAWIAGHQVHATRSSTGQLRICRRSLFERAALQVSRLASQFARLGPETQPKKD